jgi:hypothetical protein
VRAALVLLLFVLAIPACENGGGAVGSRGAATS